MQTPSQSTAPLPQHPVSARSRQPSAYTEQHIERSRSTTAALLFNVLDPIPYGFLTAALIFDVVYARSAEVLWFKAAAWLIAIGLLFAIIPRLINLARVWVRRARPRLEGEVASFWLNLLAIVAAIVNAFVHSRDAYGVMPEGMWLSMLTVALLVLARIVTALQQSKNGV